MAILKSEATQTVPPRRTLTGRGNLAALQRDARLDVGIFAVMIARQMTDKSSASRRFSPATIALGASALLAVAAIGVASYQAGRASASGDGGGDANQAAANAIAA